MPGSAFLDCLKAVGGFFENVQRSPYSNEVRYSNREPFDVRYYKDGNQHPVAKGMWNDIKGTLPAGAKFVNVVYATLLSCDSEEVPNGALVKLPLMGSSGSEWIDLKIKDGESFEITGYEDRTKGRTKYRAPLFEKIEITEDEGFLADEQDGALQEYLESMLSKKEKEVDPTDQVPDAVTDAGEPSEEEESAIPF